MAMRVVSADSHMREPAELWVERLDVKYRDRTPKVIDSLNKSGLNKEDGV